MASLNIPEHRLAALAKIASIADESMQELLSAIESVPITLYPAEQLSKRTASLRTISKSEADKVTSVLLSLYMARAGTDKSTSDFVDEVVQTIDAKGGEELTLNDENRDIFKQRLVALLDVHSFMVATRATGLLYEHDKNFSKVRILTDIRPVFDAKAEKPPVAAIIIHTLDIHYYEGTQHKEFYVTLDTKDLQALRDAIKRAEKKAQGLGLVLEKADIPYIQPE